MTITSCITTSIAAVTLAGLLAASFDNRIALAQDRLKDQDTHSGAGILLPNLAKPSNQPSSGASAKDQREQHAPNNTSEGLVTKEGSDQNTKDASPKYKWVDEQGRAH